jgi:two-component sensor histidine kinase
MNHRHNRLLRRQQHALNDSRRELQRLNVRQQKLLAEKEWLINEVHHRVRTNLQIVSSLLKMQAGYLRDAFTLHAIDGIGSRIHTIGLIHQRLYREDGDLTLIDMRDYIHELTGHLLDACDRPGVRIRPQIDPIDLTIAQGVPVGLILNEAISNTLRFAFPAANAFHTGGPAINSSGNAPEPEGLIDISMTQAPGGRILLSIADNGIGLPPDFNPDRDAAMGLQLIKTLSLQLDGDIFIENRQLPTTADGWLTGEYHGLRITVVFQREESELSGL